MDNFIFILTCTYNRPDKIIQLMDSLNLKQEINTIWIVVNDGSKTDYREFERRLDSYNNILYYRKQNEGKVKSLNFGFNKIEEFAEKNKIKRFLTLIIDDDDLLLENAIPTVKQYFNKNISSRNDMIGGYQFQFKFIGKYYNKKSINLFKSLEKNFIGNRFEFEKEFGGHDGVLCYMDNIIKKYRYPEFEHETYMGPTVIEYLFALDGYKMEYCQDVIGVAEYYEDGLTKSGRLTRLKNPLGMIEYSSLKARFSIGLFSRFKYSINLWPYYFRAPAKITIEINKLFKSRLMLFLSFPFGLILSLLWRMKYET